MRIFPSDLTVHKHALKTTSLNNISLNLKYISFSRNNCELHSKHVPRFLYHSYTTHTGRDRSGGPTEVWGLSHNSQFLLISHQIRYKCGTAV